MKLIWYKWFFLVVFFFSCSNKSETGKLENKQVAVSRTDTIYYTNGTIEQIHRIKNNKLNGVSERYYPSGVLKSKKAFIEDTARGLFLQFYENGRIKKFSYLIDDKTNIWYRSYDVNGNVVKEEGSPFLKSEVKESYKHDTFYFTAFLCKYGAKDLKFEIASDGENYKTFELSNTNKPFILQSTTWKLVRELPLFSIYMKTTFIDSNNNISIYKDTLSFESASSK